MGGAQPLAVTMNEGCALCIEVDLQRIERRIRERLPRRARRLARRRAGAAGRRRSARAGALSIGLLGNAAEVLPELVRRGAAVDVVTDQTSAHDPLNGYVPAGLTVEQADALRAADPDEYLERVGRVRARARRRDPRRSGAPAPRRSTTATRCAASRRSTATTDAFAYPGFVPAYIRPLFCEGKGPFRWVALSGDPADIAATDARDPRPVRRPGAHPRAGSSWRPSGSRSRACRRGSAGSATASATWPGCASTRWSRRASSRRRS